MALVVSGDTAETKSAAESDVTLEETHAFIRKMLLKQEILHYKKEVFGGAFCYFDMGDVDTIEDILDSSGFGSRRWSTCFLVRKILFKGEDLETDEDATG